jgi:predicted transposase YbfD/YdcC
VLAHVDIAEKSNEIPAAQALLAELGLAAGAIVTLDALHCQKNCSKSLPQPASL